MKNTRDKLDLSGEWQIIFEEEIDECQNGSVITNWPEADQKEVIVPGIWNLKYPDKKGIGYYRKEFFLPQQWEGNYSRLHFEGVFYHSSVWVNGMFVGSHEGGFTSFSVDTSSCLKPGQTNEIIVRVIGLSKDSARGGFELQYVPSSKQSWYFIYAGIWGQVSLEKTPAIFVNSLAIFPDLSNKRFSAEIVIENITADIIPITFNLTAFLANGDEVVSIQREPTVSPGKYSFTHRILLDNPIPWEPDNPYLYHLKISVENRNNGKKDEVTERFGMRDFSTRDGEFFLNGKPIYIKGILKQPNYPKTLIVPSNREFIKREIQLVKDAGFNMLRLHIHTAPPGYLDLADEIGLLVYAESPLAWIQESPRLVDHSKREMHEMILRDRNHPSVVIWGILNENRGSNSQLEDELLPYVRAIDPTRVVIDNSGGSLAIDQDFGWVDDTRVLPNRSLNPQIVMDLHLYIGGILNGSVYNWLKNLGKGVNSLPLYEAGFGFKPLIAEFDRKMADYGGKIFVSEMGCGGFTDLDNTVKGFGDQIYLVDAQEFEIIRQDLHSGFKKRNLKRIFGSIKNLERTAFRQQTLAIRSQVEAIISNPYISGYSLTQLEDVSWEFQAGILDLWQNPKPTYYELIRLNKDTVAIIHPLSHITTPHKPITLEISILHRTDPIEDVDIHLFIITPDGDKYIQTHQEISLTKGMNNLDDEQFLSGDLTGNYVIHMEVIANDTLIAESTTEILVVSDYQEIQTSAEFKWIGKIPDLPNGMSAPSNSTNKFFIAAYPSTLSEIQLRTQIEMTAHSGNTMIFGPLSPSDRMVIDVFSEFGIELKLKFGIGNWMGCHHWLPPEIINEPLFTNPLADEKFIGITPRYSLLENNGNVIAGSFQNGKSHREPVGMVWYSDIEKVRIGKGSVVFCQYRIFDQLKSHPLAIRILDGILAQSLS